jgi:hypothetical protein
VAPVRVYVAARAEELSDSQVALVAALRDRGELIWSPIGQKPHTETAQLLMTSDGVLCFESPSTYHSMEVSFALGDASWEGDGRPLRNRPLPVFAFTDGSENVAGWIWRDGRITRLPTNAISGATQLVAAVSV